MITAGEFAARRNWLREQSAARGLDGALVFSWRRAALHWFTGYSPGFLTNHATLWVPVVGESRIGVRFPFERDRAGRASGLPVVAVGEPGAMVPQDASHVGLICGDFAIDETHPGLVTQLGARGIRSVDLKEIVDDRRARKSLAEIASLRAVTLVACDALAAAGATAAEGDSDFSIAARVEGAARAGGATRCLCLVGIGHGAVVTEATGVRVRPGDPVSLEVTLYVDGACTHVNVTLPPPVPRAVDQRALAVCREVRQALCRSIVVGESVDDVVRAGDALLESHGLLSAKEYDFGHGIGCDTPEHPRLIEGTGRVFEEGMAIAVHVALRRPSGETAFVGGPVVVEPDGAHELIEAAPWAATT